MLEHGAGIAYQTDRKGKTLTSVIDRVRRQSADATLHRYIEADIAFHGFSVHGVLADVAGLSNEVIDALSAGRISWDLGTLYLIARHLRPSNPASLLAGWTFTYRDECDRD